MIRTITIRQQAVVPVRGLLSRVWIETGNPRQPLACIWIDDNMRQFSADEDRLSGDEPSRSGRAWPGRLADAPCRLCA